MAKTDGDVGFKIKATDATKAAFHSVEDGLKSLRDHVFSLQSGIAMLAGSAGFVALVKSQMDTVDQTAKVADRLGVTTQALTGLQYASDLAGVSGDQLNESLAKMSKNIGYASTIGGQYKDAILAMGIGVQKLAAMRPDQQFMAIADGLKHVSSGSQRAYIEATLMSDRTGALLNVMQTGRVELEKDTQQVKAWGAALNRVDSAKIEAANDSFTRASYAIRGMATTIAVQLSPYVTALANDFAQAAAANDGFKNQIVSGAQEVAHALGVVGTAWQYLATVADAAALGGASAIHMYSEKVYELSKFIYGTLDKIGIHVKTNDDLKIWAKATGYAVDDAAKSLQKMLNAPRASDKIDAVFAKIRADADKTAKEVAAAANKYHSHLTPAPDSILPLTTTESKALASKLKAVEASLQTQQQKIAASYAEQTKTIDLAYKHQLIDKKQYAKLDEQAENAHLNKLLALNVSYYQQQEQLSAASWHRRVNAGLNGMISLTAGVAQHSKTMFEVNKAATLAHIALNIPEAISGAYKFGVSIGGPWTGAAFAAIAGAAELAQLKAAASTQFSGGGTGTTPSSAGTSPVVNSTPQPVASAAGASTSSAPANQVQVIVQGNIIGTEDFAKNTLAPIIADAINNNDMVLINSNSRQAAIINGT